MKHIHIPETNITIPRIAASFAPAGSDYTDTHNYYLVDAYLELGGTFLDTANVYGRGFEQRLPVNELWLGRYFSERHNRHHLFWIVKVAHQILGINPSPELIPSVCAMIWKTAYPIFIRTIWTITGFMLMILLFLRVKYLKL